MAEQTIITEAFNPSTFGPVGSQFDNPSSQLAPGPRERLRGSGNPAGTFGNASCQAPSVPASQDGFSAVLERISLVRTPLCLLRNISDPWMQQTKDKFAIPKAINNAIASSPHHMQRIISSAQSGRDMLSHQVMRWVGAVPPPFDAPMPLAPSGVTVEPEDYMHVSITLKSLVRKIAARVTNFRQFVQKSPNSHLMVWSLGIISEYYHHALKIIEGYQQNIACAFALARKQLMLGFGDRGVIQTYAEAARPHFESLINKVNNVFDQLRNALGFPTHLEVDTPCQVHDIEVKFDDYQKPNLDDSISSIDCDGSEVSIASMTLTDNSDGKPQLQKESVLGKRIEGVESPDAEVCLIAVETLKSMLSEKKTALLKQPGLSRKLYAKDPRFKDSINRVGGLRAFVKRFSDEFRLFPGKGTVWFVTLRDANVDGVMEQMALETEE